MHELASGVGDCVATLAHVLDGQQDGLACIRQRLFRRVALAVAAGKRRNDRDIAAFGIGGSKTTW